MIGSARCVPLGVGRDGLVARYDDVVLFIGPNASPTATAALVALARQTAGKPGGGKALIDQLQSMFAAPTGNDYPSCAVFCEDGDDIGVLARGAVEITVHQAGQPLTIRGDVPPGWQSHRLRNSDYASARVVGSDFEPIDAITDLAAGTVKASGVVLMRAGSVDSAGAVARPAALSPSPAQPARVAPAPAPASRIVDLRAPAADAGAAGAPQPLARGGDDGAAAAKRSSSPAPSAPSSNDRAEHVKGVHCGRGHFNDPRARFCAACGLAMHQASVILTDGVRPSLGVLLFPSGATAPLARTLIVGRDPVGDPAVQTGRADPLVLADPGQNISRVHAELRLVDWDVHVVDRRSTNGTFVWDAGAQTWQRLAPEQPVRLAPGAQLAFGSITCLFESSLQQR